MKGIISCIGEYPRGTFTRRFNLEDHVEVEKADFRNGLLQIDLVRRIPEAMKPRRIEIGGSRPSKSIAA